MSNEPQTQVIPKVVSGHASVRTVQNQRREEIISKGMPTEQFRIELPATPRRRHISFLFTCLMIIGLMCVVTSGALYKMHKWPFTADTGVVECQAIAKNMQFGSLSITDSSAPEKAQYDNARRPFERSHYKDLRMSGVNVVNTIQTMETKFGEDTDNQDLTTSLTWYTKLTGNWNLLQIACSNHGIDLPDLPTG